MDIEYWLIKVPFSDKYSICLTRVDLPIDPDYLAKQIRFKTEAEAIAECNRLNREIK